jgi:hypothetical protein
LQPKEFKMNILSEQQRAAVGGGLLVKPPFYPPDPCHDQGNFERAWRDLIDSQGRANFVHEALPEYG